MYYNDHKFNVALYHNNVSMKKLNKVLHPVEAVGVVPLSLQ